MHERNEANGRDREEYGGTTESLFRAAGLEAGMRVLDVGSGAGDVAFLAARMVGAEGEVVGIGVDGAALAIARGRAGSLGLRQVSFVEDDAFAAAPAATPGWPVSPGASRR
jgi:cyclopropane fatty-acyl-phospholipid synthase-like methyltransferase